MDGWCLEQIPFILNSGEAPRVASFPGEPFYFRLRHPQKIRSAMSTTKKARSPSRLKARMAAYIAG